MKRKNRSQLFKARQLLMAGVLLCIVPGSCKENAVEPEVPIANSLELVEGDNQTAEIEAQLPEVIKVLLKDQNDEPLDGGLVYFSVAEGTLTDTLIVTNTAGEAVVGWILGSSVGEQFLEITALSKFDSSFVQGTTIIVEATATAKPPVPTTLVLVSGQNQSDRIGAVLDRPIIVQVLDQYGEPFPEATVNFELEEGELLTNDLVSTDIAGKAEARWRLSRVAGRQELKISSVKLSGQGELEGSPLTVFADATIF